MRKLTLASLLLVLGGSTLSFACNGDPATDDGADAATGGGTGDADESAGGAGTGGGGPVGACSAGEKGTSVAAGTCALINDFEGEDFTASFALDSDGRTGAGIDFESAGVPRLSGGANLSGEGSLVPATDDGADGTSQSVHFTFTGAETWGGAFSHLISNSACYDASAYTGIQFYAKAAAGSNKDIFVGVGTASTNPLYDCGTSETDPDCFNSGRKYFTLTEEWALYSATWDEFARPNWGVNWGTSTDPSEIVTVSFADAGVAATNDIEIFVDELGFTGGSDTACGEVGAGGAGGQ